MLITSIAYDAERNLGRGYNELMRRLEPDDWACFLDHDAMFTTRDWHRQIVRCISENPRAGLITAVTNRIGRKEQIPREAPKGFDMREHFVFGAKLRDTHGSGVRDITRGPLVSGVVLCISHETWKQIGGFCDGFFGVDNEAHKAVRRTGKRVLIMQGLYVFHWYRADGVGHGKAPRAKKS